MLICSPPSVAIGAFEQAYRYAVSLGIRAKLVTPMPLCDFSPDLLLELKRDKIVWGGPCQLANGRNFVIDYNGDIVPCTHLTGFPLFNIFNGDRTISRQEFLQQYNSTSSLKFRSTMSRYASVKCGDCKESCAGGCPLFWLKLNPEQNIRGRLESVLT